MSSRRIFLSGLTLPLLAAAARAQTAPSQAPKVGGRDRAYVLVHGAWHGAWCWDKVVPLLQAKGHRVFTPTQTGLGDRTHLLTRDIGLGTFIDDIAATIEMEDLRDIVLVGHSFAGAPITAVADRMPDRIAQLVYLDAAILTDGQRVLDTIPRDIVAKRIEIVMETSDGLTLPIPPIDAFGVHDEADVAWLKRHLRPHPFKTYTDTISLKNPPGHGLPTTYIACVNPGYPPLGTMHDFARKQPGWAYQEIDSGHDAMVIVPEKLADMLDRIG